ncbi:hypothetical protein AVEN_122667-1, partial [Araneus ventricosus]
FSGLIWCVWCFFTAYDSPSLHPLIKSEELTLITKNTSPQTEQITSIPWKAIATSVPFWALAAGFLGQCWILSFFVTSVALYMGTILNLGSVQVGTQHYKFEFLYYNHNSEFKPHSEGFEKVILSRKKI